MTNDEKENDKPLTEGAASAGGEPPESGAGAPAEAAAAAPSGASGERAKRGGSGPRWLPTAVGLGFPALLFLVLPPLSRSGLWDPYELNVADLARRIALNLFHADALALAGADNSLPHLNDLGRPELPFTSIALGFKLFGLHEWAGRLPLAVWGLAGVAATFAVVRRLVDKRAAVYSAIALATMPLYFVQARTMLGDIVVMSGFAMAFGGLAVAVFDRSEGGALSPRDRAPWLGLAAVGLVAGLYTRGALLGVAVPSAAVGLAWLVMRGSGARAADPLADALGASALVLGSGVAFMAFRAVGANDTKNLSLAVGAMLKPPAKYPTFDFVIGQLGPSLAPWSAFAPFAVGRLFIPPIDRPAHARERESHFRSALLVAAAVALTAHGYLASHIEPIAFSAPVVLAIACGIAIRDFERGAHGSLAVGVGTAVFLGLFHHDFHELPERAYQAFGVTNATFPESFKETSLLLWTVALVGFALFAFLTWVEKDEDRRPFDPKTYLAIVDALRDAWDGLLALVYFALVAGASLAGIAIWVGVRTHAKWLPSVSLQVRDGVLNAWWITAFVPLVVVLGAMFAADVWLWTFHRAGTPSWASFTRGFEPLEDLYAELRSTTLDRRTRLAGAFILVPLMVLAVPVGALAYLVSHHTKLPFALAAALPSGVALFLALGLVGDLLRGRRAAGLAFGGALVGFILCFFYYPALANQLSPKEVFESYERVHATGEPLGLFGVGGRTAAYYAGGQPSSFTDPNAAYGWLMGGEGKRRFLAMRADELPKLNEIFRQRSSPRENLPVLDARSSQILLVASSLAGEKNQNPLGKLILGALPRPQHPLDVNMEDKLAVLGFDLTDQNGKFVESVAPGRKYRMRTYYKVLAPVTTEWEAFIHIDGFHRRHNGDHKPMDGKYPMALWLKDDLLVDDHEFTLEPNFSPGAYTIYFGLFVGDTRLKVKSGPSDGDNRINGGPLRVQ